MKLVSKTIDIVIVGGGIAGLSLACLLAKQDWHVGLIEAREPQKNFSDADYDLRVSAITPASKDLFNAIGVWSAIENSRCGVFRKMRVWDAQGGGEITFDSAYTDKPALGYIVENSLLQVSLYQQLLSYKNVEIFCPSRLKEIKLGADYAKVELEEGHRLLARLVVGADGLHSKVRDLAQIAIQIEDYQHTAIVANVTTALSHQQIASQSFLPTGPLAFLPLAEMNCSSIVWSTSPAQAQYLLALDKKDFCCELANAYNHRLGAVTACSERLSFNLQMRQAQRYIAPPIVLLGDAAHSIHPLAGQGVNLGLQDAQCLAQVLAEAKQKQREINSLATLRRYERARKSVNSNMITLVGGLKALFMSENTFLHYARNMGLNILDKCEPVKQYFVEKASRSVVW